MTGGERPLMLAIDTATQCCSVALTAGDQGNGRILAELTLCSTVTHSRRLLAMIERLLAETTVTWEMLDGIAVSIGPGSFTGLRIGLATAKGLACAAAKPLLGVSTLTSLASVCSTSRLICAALDARKKEVYAAFFRRDEEDKVRQIGKFVVISPEQLAEDMQEPVYMTGDALAVYGEYWRQVLGKRLATAPSQLRLPSAASLGLLAAEQLQAGETLDIGSASPFYVRASEAELNLLRKSCTVPG